MGINSPYTSNMFLNGVFDAFNEIEVTTSTVDMQDNSPLFSSCLYEAHRSNMASSLSAVCSSYQELDTDSTFSEIMDFFLTSPDNSLQNPPPIKNEIHLTTFTDLITSIDKRRLPELGEEDIEQLLFMSEPSGDQRVGWYTLSDPVLNDDNLWKLTYPTEARCQYRPELTNLTMNTKYIEFKQSSINLSSTVSTMTSPDQTVSVTEIDSLRSSCRPTSVNTSHSYVRPIIGDELKQKLRNKVLRLFESKSSISSVCKLDAFTSPIQYGSSREQVRLQKLISQCAYKLLQLNNNIFEILNLS